MKRIISAVLALSLLFGNLPPVIANAQENEAPILETQEESASYQEIQQTEAEVFLTETTAPVQETLQAETEPVFIEETIPVQETQTVETESVLEIELITENAELSAVQEEPAIEEHVIEDLISVAPEGMPETDELLEIYLVGLFYGRNDISFLGDLARAELNTQGQNLYDHFKSLIVKVAAGEESSVKLEITHNQLVNWGGAELYAVSSATEARDACKEDFQTANVISALLHDCPFDLYWFDKVSGVQMVYYIGGSENAYQITKIECVFSVVGDFQASDYASTPAVNTAKVTSAVNAASNAKSIVAKYADKNDFEKLKSYKNEIISLVDYNYAADPDQFSADADPWQLVYVFDGNSSTKVVCEGYSKAFQYLCDMSEFRESVNCYSVTGYLGTSSGAQGHMWNIVTIEGENYLADITNSDTGTVGAGGSLFLAGGSGSITNGYTIASTGFVYDKSTINLWGSGEGSILNLADGPYTLCGNGHDEKILPAVPATCTEDGLTEGAVCQRCGATTREQETVTAPGHTVETLEAVDATCTQDGLTEGSWCSVCKTVFTAQEVIPASGKHDYVDNVCQDCGAIGGSCGENLTWTLVDGVLTISGTGDMKDYSPDDIRWHPYTADIIYVRIADGVTSIGTWAFYECSNLTGITIPDSVTDIGYMAFSECSSLTGITIPEGVTKIDTGTFSECDSLSSINIPKSVTAISYSAFNRCTSLKNICFEGDAPEIAETAFAYVTATAYYPAGNSTWTEDMFQNYNGSLTWIPDDCKENHTEVIDEAVNATCTTTGLTEGKHCSVCGKVLVAQEVTEKLPHSAGESVQENKVAASCKAEGSYDEVVYCSECGEELSREAKTIKKQPHTDGEIVHKNEIAASCKTEGSYDEVIYCSECGEELSRETKTIEKLPHTAVEDAAVGATCTATGLTAGSHCSICGEVIVEQDVTEKLPHSGGSPGRENEEPASCKAEGSYDEVICCIECGEELSRETKTIEKLPHTVVEDAAVGATCTTTGLTEGKHCFVCGEVLAAQEVIPATGHAYDDDRDVDCNNCGEQREICSLAAPAKPYKAVNVVSGPHIYWKAVKGAAKYGLWRSENGINGTYKWLANPTVPHFTDLKVQTGKTYYYKVTAMDSNGKHSAMSHAIGIIYVATPDITSRFNKGAGVQVGWNKIDGATGYGIYRKSFDGDDAWVRVATISGNSTFTWIDSSVKNSDGVIYRYTVRALAGSNMKTLSGCRAVGRTMVRLSSRVLTGASKSGTNAIRCNWTTSSAVTGYEVRFMVGNEVYKTVTIGNWKTGSRTFSGLPAGQEYKIQVRAYKKVDGVGSFYSAWSVAKYVKL